MRAKLGVVALLLSLLFTSVVGISMTASASGTVDVSIIPSTVHTGQSFDVHFKVNSQFQGQAAATVEVGTCPGCSDVWKNTPLGVYSGLSYDASAPPISTPGRYIATVVVVIPGAMGGAAVGGSANFKVVGSATQTQIVISTTSQATTQAQTVSSTTVEAPFDFAISVSPTEQTVTPGQSAAYVAMVELVAGSSKTVNLSTQNITAGIDVSFDPQSGKPPFTSLLTVSTSQAVSPGQVTITVRGTGGGKTRTADFTLIVGTGQTETQASTANSGIGNLTNLMEQNSGLVIAVIAIIVILVIFASRAHRKSTGSLGSQEEGKADVHGSLFLTRS
ncbi:MAG: hypothetical protein ACLP5V_09975 [Candidatus Bathyarchaeia archaeon]